MIGEDFEAPHFSPASHYPALNRHFVHDFLISQMFLVKDGQVQIMCLSITKKS